MRKIDLFVKTGDAGEITASPLIILNTTQDEGQDVYDALCKMTNRDFVLAAISGLNWGHDMTPWEVPAIPHGDPCTGGAGDYIENLRQEIIPDILSRLDFTPSFTAIAGYSLAGLFALYCCYKTDIFDRVISVSGSLWYPGFMDFVGSNEMLKRPDKMYISLGDKEAKTRIKMMQPVRENTDELVRLYKEAGIDLTYEINPGNHFTDVIRRTAKGIRAVL